MTDIINRPGYYRFEHADTFGGILEVKARTDLSEIADDVHGFVAEHKAVCIRGLGATADMSTFRDTAAALGEVQPRFGFPATTEDPVSSVIKFTRARLGGSPQGKGNYIYHHDAAFDAFPRDYAVLGMPLPTSSGGATDVLDTTQGFEAARSYLSETGYSIDKLWVVHSLHEAFRGSGHANATERIPDVRATKPLVARNHRAPEQPGVYSNELSTEQLLDQHGDPIANSRELISEINRRLLAPESAHRAFQLREGEVLVIDHRRTMHRGVDDTSESRELWATSVKDVAAA